MNARRERIPGVVYADELLERQQPGTMRNCSATSKGCGIIRSFSAVTADRIFPTALPANRRIRPWTISGKTWLG